MTLNKPGLIFILISKKNVAIKNELLNRVYSFS